jgi:hypothetical protein
MILFNDWRNEPRSELLLEKILVAYMTNTFQVVMELECSLPFSKPVATVPFPNPDNCNPHS